MRSSEGFGSVLLAATAVLAILSALACASMIPHTEATLTDLAEGRTLTVQIPDLRGGGGKMTATSNYGESFSGSFAVIPGKPSGEQMLRQFARAYAWSEGNTSLAWSLDQISNREEYTGNLVGDKGTVVDLLFAIDTKTGHGTGTATDNKKTQYKVIL